MLEDAASAWTAGHRANMGAMPECPRTHHVCGSEVRAAALDYPSEARPAHVVNGVLHGVVTPAAPLRAKEWPDPYGVCEGTHRRCRRLRSADNASRKAAIVTSYPVDNSDVSMP